MSQNWIPAFAGMSEGEATPYNALVTTALGIAGAFVATYLGQALGWYHAGEAPA